MGELHHVLLAEPLHHMAGCGEWALCHPQAASNDPSRLPEMNMQLLIPQTFILAVVTRMYYRKQDDKPGYQPFGFAPASTDVKA